MTNFVEPTPEKRHRPNLDRASEALSWLAFWKRSRAGSPKEKRRRIALWAILLGLIAGAIELPLPAEDAFRALRATVQMHPADGEVLVVMLDDKSLNAIGANEPSRGQDARLIDRLFRMGAKRVFFDRVYADATELSEDRKFVAALERYRGKVFVGALSGIEQNDGSTADLLPHSRFRSSVEIVSLKGQEGPFGLSARFPTTEFILGTERRSLSAELANLQKSNGVYRPDFSIDYMTIPTLGYIDIFEAVGVEAAVRGRDVVVAPSSRSANDFHPMPYRMDVRKVPGVFFHVLGAETLKRGFPLDLGWLPAFFVACLIVVTQARRQRPSKRVLLFSSAGYLLVPFALDSANISIDVMPGIICLTIAYIRLHRLARRTYLGATGLQRIETMHTDRAIAEKDVFALKVRNFAIISASLTPPEVEQLLDKVLTMLRGTDPDAKFAFHKDTFVWARQKSLIVDAEDHIRGLHAIFRTSISVGSHAPDVTTSLGLDANYDASMRERTENAIQCAEDAARAGDIFRVNEGRLPEDRDWHLQILSELENAIANGEVDVAFQPKVNLSSLAIVGAEALLRWSHPTRGPINPSHVIAIAEAHRRMAKITNFVLNRALSQARLAIAYNSSFQIAINISALDLHDPMFPFLVEHSIAAHRIPAANVVLEITETAQIDDERIVAETLSSLKRMGVQLSVDDFGTGHATLAHLRRIPADEVKIDQSFVMGMEANREDRMLVKTAIDMIHSLGRRAVAEGVDSPPILSMLRSMECDEAQGYLFSKPITMRALLPQLSSGVAVA